MRSLRVLFVTDRWDGPYRYRCLQACLQLRGEGVLANVLHVSDPALLGEIARYGVVVLFRLVWNETVEELLEVARRAGLAVLFDIDDLAFDPSLDGLMPFHERYRPAEWAATYGRQMLGLKKTFLACDAFVGSTPELAEHAARLGKPAHVHPNVVPELYLRSGSFLHDLSGVLKREPTIGYFSGSDTHDEDFASIAPAMARVLRDRPRARLVVCGHLQVSGRYTSLESRIVRLPYMNWRDFAFAYAICHVTLAPLSVKNAFTDAKSALKFFEAGAFYTPTIASPVREMVSAIRHDETGWLAETESDWERLTERALAADTSARVGRAARAAVEAGHSFAAVRGRLRAILEKYASTATRAAPELLPIDPPDETGESGPVRTLLRPATAVRNLTRVWAASRRRVGEPIDVEALERLIDRATESEVARREALRCGVNLVGSFDFSAWRGNEQIAPDGELPGESRSLGADPHLTSPEIVVEGVEYRYVALVMRASTRTGSARAQVYWTKGKNRGFEEAASSTCVVTADGSDSLYLFDFGGASTFAPRRRRKRKMRLRVDPVDGPGSFRLVAVLLVAEAPSLERFRETESLEPRALEVTAADVRGGLGAIESLAPGEHARLRLSGSVRDVRAELARELPGKEVDVLRLFGAPDGVVAEVVRRRARRSIGVDIVLPVYNAREFVERCVRSVLEHARGDYRLVIVDDASTDADLRAFLVELASNRPNVVLLTNPKNLGFLETANRGFRAAGTRDVLLLNSDTEVFEGFLERLVDCAYSDDRIGLVSPLSNNATILSVPEFCRSNDLPAGTTARDVAAIVRGSSKRQRPEIVTPHGFCMYAKAAFLAEVGVFDAAHFGRGYGEENDLGERAKAAGWKIVAADDVYVWHAGKGSFGDEGRGLEGKHASVLEALHPSYFPDVAQFVRKNPLAHVQSTVRRNIQRRSHDVAPAPLFVLHDEPFGEHPGGVEHSVRDLVRATALARAVLLYPSADSIEVLEITDGDLDARLAYRFPVGRLPERFCHAHDETARIFAEVLSLFRIGWVHIHHLMFLPLTLPRILRDGGLPYVVTVHDFYWACPSFNLLDMRTVRPCCPESCGDAERTAACQRALFRALGEPLPHDPVSFVDEHRALAKEALNGAHAVIFPSPSAARLTTSMLGLSSSRTRVIPHGYEAPRVARGPRTPSGPLRVAIVGQLSYASKGADAYLSVMERLANDAVEWHLFGRTDLFDFERRLAARAPLARVVRHGAYEREAIVPSLVEAGIDVGLLLPAWPETFSYTLSELASAEIPVVARRVGALADRLEGEPWARLVDDATGAADVLAALARERGALVEMTRAVRRPEGTKAWALAYAELYRECRTLSPVRGSEETTAPAYSRLAEVMVEGSRATRGAPARVTQPAPEIAATTWYRYAERLKPHVPESLRHYARRRLSANSVAERLRFRLPGRRATIGDGLRLDRRYLTTSRLTSHGTDPYLLLATEPFDPRDVEFVRFNLWCSTPKYAFAQLYWRHEGAAAFDEENSIVIPLDGKLDAWQEYVMHFDGTHPCRAWYEGGPVVELRFDPINLPGPIGLGELALCGNGRRK